MRHFLLWRFNVLSNIVVSDATQYRLVDFYQQEPMSHRFYRDKVTPKPATASREPNRSTPDQADSIPPELRMAMERLIEVGVETVVKRRWIDPHAEAFSIEQFGLLNGNLGRQLIHDEINAGRLGAKKVGSRTIIPRSSSKQWLENLPDVKPKDAKKAAEAKATPPPEMR
jgi:hypothetical protein